MKPIFLILLVFIISFTASAFGQFEGAVWDTLTSDTLLDALSRQPFVATPGGLHLTYGKSRGAGNGWSVHYRFFDIAGGWNNDVIVESELPAYSPSIAAREFGAFKIAIFFDAHYDIYGGIVNSPWEPWDIMNLTGSPEPDFEPTVAVDDGGDVHVAWIMEIGGEYKIAYGRMENDTLAIEVLYESDLGPFGSGAVPRIVTVDNLPHIFYRGANGGFYHIHHAFKASPESPWEIEFLYSGNADDYTGSALVDDSNNIYLAVSGNDGWGLPGRIYYSRQDHQSGYWTPFELATGTFSVTEGTIGITDHGHIYIASAGISGNIYTGDIFISTNADGSFQTEFLAHYQDGTGPSIAFLPGSIGALVMKGFIWDDSSNSMEILFYGPTITGITDSLIMPRSDRASFSFPNPFNSSTVIMVRGDLTGSEKLDIYDPLGRKVRTIKPYNSARGILKFWWDGADNGGGMCPSGIYFYSVKGKGRAHSGRMLFLK